MTATVHALLTATRPTDSSMREQLAPFTARPLDETISDLRAELRRTSLDLEGYRRLHILISHLYHRCGADIPQTVQLRAEVNRALSAADTEPRSREEGINHVVQQP